MKKIVSLVTVLLMGAVWAVPRNNTLKAVDAVKVINSGKSLKVSYSLPCDRDDWSKLVFVNDDEGDYTVGVGVVYSHEAYNCKNGTQKKFVKVVKNKYGKDAYFWPMDVK